MVLDCVDGVCGFLLERSEYSFWKARRLYPGKADALVAETADWLVERSGGPDALSWLKETPGAGQKIYDVLLRSKALDDSATLVIGGVPTLGLLLAALGVLIVSACVQGLNIDSYAVPLLVPFFISAILLALGMGFREKFINWLCFWIYAAAVERIAAPSSHRPLRSSGAP